MAICPECGEEIDCLEEITTGTMRYRLSLVNGKEEYDMKDFESDCRGDPTYLCPECYEELPFSTDEAIEFLKGETEDDNE